MKTTMRIVSVAVMLTFAFYAIKVIAFKQTVTQSDIVMLIVSTVSAGTLGIGQSLARARDIRRAREQSQKTKAERTD
ncbi:MAG: hypothetical protein QM691_04575 [Opitutaceae bacterium]